MRIRREEGEKSASSLNLAQINSIDDASFMQILKMAVAFENAIPRWEKKFKPEK